MTGGWKKEKVREVESLGWTIDGWRGKHVRLVHPNGSVYFAAATPSDWRAWKNTISALRRLGNTDL